MEADDETYGAEWFTVKETIALAKKDSDMIKRINNIPRIKALKEAGERGEEERTRGVEMIHMFHWAEQGTKVFDLGLYYGEDGEEIDNKIVEVKTKFSVLLVIQSEEAENQFAVEKKVLKKGFDDFTESAYKFSTQLVKKDKGLESLEVSNLCGVYHIAPKTKKNQATMTICYLAKTNRVGPKSKLTFRSLEDFQEGDSETLFAVKNVAEGVLAPLEMLDWEGSKHAILG